MSTDTYVRDAQDAAWYARFDVLVAYLAERGTIPLVSTPGLGNWVREQRSAARFCLLSRPP